MRDCRPTCVHVQAGDAAKQLAPQSTHHAAAGLASACPPAVGACAAGALPRRALPVGLARLTLRIALRVGRVLAAHQLLLLLSLLRLRGVGGGCGLRLLLLRGIGRRRCRDRLRPRLLLLLRCAAGALTQLAAHSAAPARHPCAAVGF